MVVERGQDALRFFFILECGDEICGRRRVGRLAAASDLGPAARDDGGLAERQFVLSKGIDECVIVAAVELPEGGHVDLREEESKCCQQLKTNKKDYLKKSDSDGT